jgi:hypothetical protein
VFKSSGDGKTRKWLSWEARPFWIKAETYLAAPSDYIVPEWAHGEPAGFSELAIRIFLNYYPFIRKDGAPFRFQLELL